MSHNQDMREPTGWRSSGQVSEGHDGDRCGSPPLAIAGVREFCGLLTPAERAILHGRLWFNFPPQALGIQMGQVAGWIWTGHGALDGWCI